MRLWRRTSLGRRGAAALSLAASLLLGATACAGSGGVKVDLGKRIRVPEVRTADGNDSSSAPHPLRVAITGLLTPTETLAGYASLLAYLEEGLGRPVRLVQRATYAELNALMEAGQLDAALVCPLPYVQGHRAFGMELLAATVHRGEPTHDSYLIVPADSEISGLDDLRGRVFAFTDPDSNSGWLVPAYHLARRGETPDTFFGRYLFTYHHSESVRSVADHLVEGAAVDSLVYDYLTGSDPGLVGRTRVVARWGPYPSPPFVVRPDLDRDIKERLRRLLLTMDQDPAGREILQRLELEGWVPVPDAAYDRIREMEARVRAGEASAR